VTCPAVDVATTPVSITPVKAAAEKVVMRIKNVELSAEGFVTLVKVTVTGVEVGATELAALVMRSSADVDAPVVQPVVSPSPADDGWLATAEAPLNPVTGVQAPLAVVHGTNETA